MLYFLRKLNDIHLKRAVRTDATLK